MEQRIVVTGASSGIGRAVAVHAVRRGWRVLAVARRAERLASLAQETGCETLVADLTSDDDVARLVDAATGEFERGYVNVADMVTRQPWDDTVPVQVTWSKSVTA